MQTKQRNKMASCLAAVTAVVLTAVMFTVGAPTASAATKTVQIPAGQNAFTPPNLGNINVGDTITWKNNDSHNVTSANIPAGATAFESPFMTGATASFSQTFTVPGNYRYLCTLHASAADANAATQGSQMVGQFTVVGTAPTTSPTTSPTTPPTGVPTVVPTVVPVVPTGRTVYIEADSDEWSRKSTTGVKIGDRVRFTDLKDDHNAISTAIPVGAARFAYNQDLNEDVYDGPAYLVTVPGVYGFLCSMHTGMSASFTAEGSIAPVPGATTPSVGTPSSGVVPTGRTVYIEADSHEWSRKSWTGVMIGDRVRFTDLKDDHNAISTAIPVGAARFAYNQDLNEDVYDGPAYLVTVPGVYGFLCSMHTGMTASFTTAGFVPTVPVPTPTATTGTPPSGATKTVQIAAGQTAFTPQNLGNINVGDTITWKNNDSHNVVSANIPAGATAFESPFMTGATASFSQTFTVPGNYRYLCTLHASAADANAATQGSTMVGEFTVVAGTTVPPTGVPTV